MARTRVFRFLGHAGNNFKQYYDAELEQKKTAAEKEERQRRAMEADEKHKSALRHKSKIPTILELHKKLNIARREINEMRAANPGSRRISILEARYHHIDELLMRKLKEE